MKFVLGWTYKNWITMITRGSLVSESKILEQISRDLESRTMDGFWIMLYHFICFRDLHGSADRFRMTFENSDNSNL